MNNELRQRSAKILSLALGRPVDPVSNPVRGETPDWESLKHVEMVLMLEEEFRICLTEEEAGALQSLDQIVQAMRSQHGS
jgi:acyl carrier protein